MSKSHQNQNDYRNGNTWWQDLVHAWPIIVSISAIFGVLIMAWGDQYVSDIAKREYDARVKAEPVIAAMKNEITSIKGSIENLEGNDDEIRAQLGTVVSRLDTLISIQLQDHD